MGAQVNIEVQDQFGAWHRVRQTSCAPASVRQGLKAALKKQLAQHSGKARAVDAETGEFIDMMQA